MSELGPHPDRLTVKICGLTRVEDAIVAAHAGADLLGAILSDGFGRSVPAERVARYHAETSLPLVGVVVNEPLERLVALADEAEVRILQLHGDETPELVGQLREEGPWELWKALQVRSADEVIAALARYGDIVDGLLLDGWHPEHRGGSGVRFPWDLVEPLRGRFPGELKFVAAGGLNPDNVSEAVTRLRPDVVDVSSGVEITHGVKEPGRVRSFVRAARAGARQIPEGHL